MLPIHCAKKPYEKLADGKVKKVEVPYEIPDSWEWVRLGNIILQNIGGGTPNKGNQEYWNGDIPWASVKDLNVEFLTETQDYITKYGLENSSTNIVPKDNIIIATRMGLRKVCNNKIDVAINQDLRGLIFLNAIVSSYFMEIYPILKFSSSGTTVKGISLESLNSHLIPLPPLAEQKRIVTQIEHALKQVEIYAENYHKLQELEKAFPDKLKKSILQYAMQGKLVAQDPNDEPVKVLLEKIRAEKQKLYEEGKLKKKDLAEILTEKGDDNSPYQDVPYDLPESWEWVRLKTIYQVINGDRGKNYPSKDKLFENGEIPFINAGNIANEVISSQNLLYLSEEQYNKLGNGKLIKGDVIFCLRGSLGKFGIFNMEKGAIASSLVIIRPYYNNSKDIDIYFSKYLASPVLLSEIRKYNNGTAQPNLSAKALNNFFIPLPPLAEQKRIVSKISKIFSVIETLV